MAKLSVPPTKSNMQRLKRDLGFAREGYEMLERKRQILLLELIGTIEEAKSVQDEVKEKMERAFVALRKAQMRRGTWRMTADTVAPSAGHTAEIQTRPVMGIYLPKLKASHPLLNAAMQVGSDSAAYDDAAAAFQNALESIDRLAEIETTVYRLAREVRRTLRRVNALEKIFIPAYESTLRFIGGVLEERERDEFVIMRMVRERLDRQRNAERDTPD